MRTDLDHFPASEAGGRMMSRISPIYTRSYAGKWIFQVMGAEIDELRKYFEELRLQAFPETATWGLLYFEQGYGLEYESTDLEARRRYVLTRRSTKAPMSPARIKEIAGKLCACEVDVAENTAPYTFSVIIQGDTDVDYRKLVDCVRRIKPSHQSFDLVNPASFGIEIDSDTLLVLDSVFPVDKDWVTELDINCGVGIRQQASLAVTYEGDADEKVSAGGRAFFIGEVPLPPALQESVSLRAEVGGGAKCEGGLTVLKNLWTLDGSIPLDGNRLLNAEMYSYEL